VAILEDVSCTKGYDEHSHWGHVIEADGAKIIQYYCPRCNQVVTIERTGEHAL